MSGSSYRGKNWITDKLKKIKKLFEIREILDIGTGAGTYSDRYRTLFQNSNWTGIEVWQDFVGKYDLLSKYDKLIVQDARAFDYTKLPPIDIAFAGDVLEHMTKQEAMDLVDSVLNNSKCLIVSLPVVYWPQDEFEGNPYEVHVKPDWTDKEFLETFGELVVAAHVDVNIGVYVLSTDKDFIDTFTKLKVAVYAISLNEVKHVDRFMDSCQDADLVVISDTGSTDGTVERFKERGAVVYNISQKPWRFDIARNTSLNLVPQDIDLCICLDLDEILTPGWRELLEKAWKDSKGTVTRVRYDFVWNWKEDGTPDVRFYSHKIHHRNNYIWKHPCHEIMYWFGEGEEKSITIPELQIQHHPDNTKSRGQYLDLLELAVQEAPENDRMRYYYARELMYYNRYQDCIRESLHHLSMPSAVWNEERAASYRNMSQCYRYLGNMKESQNMAMKGVLECSTSREPWLQLALISQLNKDWRTSYWAATKCLEVTTRTMSYVGRSSSWGSDPYDNAALAAYYLGRYQEALEYGVKALELDPGDERLKNNLDFYKQKVNDVQQSNIENNQF